MVEKSALTAAEARKAVGQYGKVIGSASYYHGRIIGVDAFGDYLLFQRGHRGNFKPKWYHRSDVFPHDAGAPAESRESQHPSS